MKRTDWILLWCWVVWLVAAGPYLISARNWELFGLGLASLAALIYFTQRRIVPIIKAKFNEGETK